MNRHKLLNSVAFAAVAATIVSILPSHAAGKFNVKSFGAVGDDTIDDTAAIQAAINAAQNRGTGSIVIFPPGTYLITAQLTAQSVSLLGTGNARIDGSPVTGAYALSVGGSNVSVSNLGILGNGSSGSAGLYVSAQGAQITHLTITNENEPIVTIGGKNIEIAHSRFTIPTFGVGLYVGSKLVSVHDNVIVGPNDGSAGCVNFAQATDASFISNQVSGIGVGVTSVLGLRTLISQNNFSVATVGVNSVNDKNTTISNNVFVGQNQFNSEGIATQLDDNLRINSNQIKGFDYLVTLYQTSKATVESNEISKGPHNGVYGFQTDNLYVKDNNVHNIGSGGICVTSGTNVVHVSGNNLKNCGTLTSGSAIYVNSPAATFIPIKNNIYKAPVNNLDHFIHCVQPQPPADVSGNKTNTLLDTLIGS